MVAVEYGLVLPGQRIHLTDVAKPFFEQKIDLLRCLDPGNTLVTPRPVFKQDTELISIDCKLRFTIIVNYVYVYLNISVSCSVA